MNEIECKVTRENLHAQVIFTRPIFRWQDSATRFFEVIHDTLGLRLNIQAGELSFVTGNSLGEVRVRYTIYGGASSVTLTSDKLSFDFPGLQPSDLPLVYDIFGAVHDRFPIAFPEIEQTKTEVQNYAHLDLGTPEAVQKLLGKFEIREVHEAFSPTLVLNKPSVKFLVVAQDGSWQSECSAEQSQLVSSGVFVSLRMTFHKFPSSMPFLEKAETTRDITRRCLSVIGLGVNNDAS